MERGVGGCLSPSLPERLAFYDLGVGFLLQWRSWQTGRVRGLLGGWGGKWYTWGLYNRVSLWRERVRNCLLLL